jgi:DNA invertase Pin-like site-specific DNA recombinase
MSEQTEVRIGYARVSTDGQDLQAQLDYLTSRGVRPEHIHTDKLSGKDTERPGLHTALAQAEGAAATGSRVIFTVPKLDRLGRSIVDLQGIAAQLAKRGILLEFAGKIHDPNRAEDKLFFNTLATFAEFERDMIRQRTREGLAVAKAQGKMRGGKPKLSETQRSHMRALYAAGTHTISDLQREFKVGRATVYRILKDVPEVRDGS